MISDWPYIHFRILDLRSMLDQDQIERCIWQYQINMGSEKLISDGRGPCCIKLNAQSLQWEAAAISEDHPAGRGISSRFSCCVFSYFQLWYLLWNTNWQIQIQNHENIWRKYLKIILLAMELAAMYYYGIGGLQCITIYYKINLFRQFHLSTLVWLKAKKEHKTMWPTIDFLN